MTKVIKTGIRLSFHYGASGFQENGQVDRNALIFTNTCGIPIFQKKMEIVVVPDFVRPEYKQVLPTVGGPFTRIVHPGCGSKSLTDTAVF